MQKILEELWFPRRGATNLQIIMWFSEEGRYVMDIVHERTRLMAVVQCSGVCEATALAKRRGAYAICWTSSVADAISFIRMSSQQQSLELGRRA